ncbi:MAG: Vitamin B12 dependent methionine synthase activation subunit [Hespellia sp.]|nr:Vitamin B12 dependent methionine synthase activation subunit [Hespellia sp.]
MTSREKEAIRYLGYGSHTVDEKTISMIADAFSSLDQVVQKRSVCRIFDMVFVDASRIQIGNLEIQSKNLGKNLKGCCKVAMFGATLGINVDRLIQRTSILNMADAVALQACAAAILEEYCDEIQRELEEQMQESGYYLRPRFSPGYGDFSIEYQSSVIAMLDCSKTIGLTLTDSCMMAPTKSVTALIGISDTKLSCHRQGCEVCTKTDCLYRRDTI